MRSFVTRHSPGSGVTRELNADTRLASAVRCSNDEEKRCQRDIRYTFQFTDDLFFVRKVY